MPTWPGRWRPGGPAAAEVVDDLDEPEPRPAQADEDREGVGGEARLAKGTREEGEQEDDEEDDEGKEAGEEVGDDEARDVQAGGPLELGGRALRALFSGGLHAQAPEPRLVAGSFMQGLVHESLHVFRPAILRDVAREADVASGAIKDIVGHCLHAQGRVEHSDSEYTMV